MTLKARVMTVKFSFPITGINEIFKYMKQRVTLNCIIFYCLFIKEMQPMCA